MTEQPLTLTQEQDHDRRLGQLEGIQPLPLRVRYIGRILIQCTHRRPFVQR